MSIVDINAYRQSKREPWSGMDVFGVLAMGVCLAAGAIFFAGLVAAPFL